MPRIPPSKPSFLASDIPNVKPSGRLPTISHVATSPLPLTYGRTASIFWFTIKSMNSVGYSRVNGKSRVSSSRSQIPSPSVSVGTSIGSIGEEEQASSVSSDQVSLSSSKSSISAGSLVDSPINSSGIPSPSVSLNADGSSGNSSGPTAHPPLAGISGPSQIPSPSVSGFSESVLSGAPNSSSFAIPSPSMSVSMMSQIPSPSMSLGKLVSLNGSVEHSTSCSSKKVSLSSSSSSTKVPMYPSGNSFGIPSPSVSIGKFGS